MESTQSGSVRLQAANTVLDATVRSFEADATCGPNIPPRFGIANNGSEPTDFPHLVIEPAPTMDALRVRVQRIRERIERGECEPTA